MKYLEAKEGSIFFIPLFLPNGIKENLKGYGRYKFEEKGPYAFGRLIEDGKSLGHLIEIFNYVGAIPNEYSVIIDSGRMFAPVHTTMGFQKKRYRFIFESMAYDKEIDSNYKEIGFRLANEIWKGGNVIKNYSKEDWKKYDDSILYPPTQLENKIREHIDMKVDLKESEIM